MSDAIGPSPYFLVLFSTTRAARILGGAMIIRGFIAPIFKKLDTAVQERVLHMLKNEFQLEYV